MQTRSFYETVLRSPEDGGSPAPAAQTASQPVDTGSSPDASVDTPSDTRPKDTGNEPPPLEDQLSKIWDDAHSPVTRDPLTGKFQSKNPKPAEAKADDGLDDDLDDDLDGPEGATDPLDGDDDPTAGDEQGDGPAEATEAMPRSWSKEDAKVWKAMPKEARDVVLRREGQMTQVLSRAGNAVKALKDNEPLIQGAEPFRDYMRQREQHTGVPQARLINDVMRMTYGLDTAPNNEAKLDILNEIVGAFGVDISPWIGRDAAESLRSATPAHDPRVDQLTKVVNDLAAEREQLRRQQEEQSTAELTTAISSAESNTREFPYFRHVRERMAQEIQLMSEAEAARSVPELLKDAYERACWATPKVRARLMREQGERTTEAQTKQSATRLEKAERASAANVKSGVPSPSKRTMDDDIEATASRLYGR